MEIGTGFPEFTRFFNHSFLWKLQSCVNLSMTIGTQKCTFFKFLQNLVPASGVPFAGNSKIFF